MWNRMSSGSYFPPPVRGVEISKPDGRKRLLGIATVLDRVGQGVVKSYLEPLVEPKFHEDSSGYRPGKSALEAVGVARKRSWSHDWCIALDIKGFFDNLDHSLMMKALRHPTKEQWIHLYVERWLKAPLQREAGEQLARRQGTRQGGVLSPLLANIFMHHAFDEWMKRQFPTVKFERFADDVLVPCSWLVQAEHLLESLKARLKDSGLELNEEKTKIVYCKDSDRRGTYAPESFDILGYTFRPRLSKNRWGKTFLNFTPAISNQAERRIGQEVRSWRLHQRSDKSLTDLARKFNAQVQGRENYYGGYYKSAMYPLLRNLERNLMRWVRRKSKSYRGHRSRAKDWLGRVRSSKSPLFVPWRLGLGSAVG
ncbi:MAG: group II intron reverse transcriptase/maturase [Cytophagales bacterium]|nr:group II intron reverse transcriptase/maturase [Cytophagales bacterium]